MKIFTPVFIFAFLLLQQNANAVCLKTTDYTQAGDQNTLEQEIESYYSLIEESLHHRAISLELLAVLTLELSQKDYLSARTLNKFKQAIQSHLELRQRLYQVAKSRECWLRNSYVSMEPELRLKGIMLSLSAALTLYDNYLLVIAMFQENEQLRRIIDQPDLGFGLSSNELLGASQAFHSVLNREKVKSAVKFYKKQFKYYKLSDKTDGSQESSLAYLNMLIEQSPSYQMMQKDSALSILQNKIKFYSIVKNDSLNKLETEGVNLLSQIFGNSIGMVESRKGKLYQRTKVHKDLLNTLQAGDILLEKTPFRLTDQFIPGYWGHAAIWAGSEKELKQLGLWDHPAVKPWQQQIRNEQTIIEALRTGVQLDPLSHFMNIDDMVVLRDKKMTKDQIKQVIVNAFRQLGKSYDFNFDISSSDRIVCSELVYMSYLHINWPTAKAFGRYTISPDHIATKAQDAQLSVVKLYLDGQSGTGDLNHKLLNTLSAR
ncbi:MAG: YiiX/YebB-like N1pC/P60 family cysteine hydrolase [Gammaproteobacteria bacterium]|nr:YiiX/YebB-like N1pC/P60 family cysteine hydrolase [Gammaproteobacteria bacterium]